MDRPAEGWPGEIDPRGVIHLPEAQRKLGLARQRGDLCGEFAQAVLLVVGQPLQPSRKGELAPLTLEEIGTTMEELEELITIGKQRTNARIALLRARCSRAKRENEPEEEAAQ